MSYNLLVIDDEIEIRKNTYMEVFACDQIELFFLEKFDIGKVYEQIDSPATNGILLDMLLQNWERGNNAQELFDDILRYVKKKKPLFIISRHFHEIASWLRGKWDGENDIIDFFGWEEICNAEGNIRNEYVKSISSTRVYASLNRYYKRTNAYKKPDEKIVLLHLSDLQFGDPNFNQSNVMAAPLFGDQLVQKYQVTPDLIAITGDVAYSGIPSQFNQAREWIQELCEQIFPEEFRSYGERLLFVPGNHDVNLSLSASDFYEYNFPQTGDEYLRRRSQALKEHITYGLMPFAEFAFKMTRNSHWIEQKNNLCWMNDRFLNWGIQFVHLNTVSELDYMSPAKFSVKEEAIQNLIKENKFRQKVFTIYLAHNGPDDMGYKRGLSHSRECLNLFTLINTLGGNLFLHGHRHKTCQMYKLEYKGGDANKMDYILSGTMSLNKVREPDSSRSFSVIELNRANGFVQSIEHRIFEINEQRIRELKD